MTNLDGDIRKGLGNIYGLRTWIEYGFKQIKNELGWADYRVTDYEHIERWWRCCIIMPLFGGSTTSEPLQIVVLACREGVALLHNSRSAIYRVLML